MDSLKTVLRAEAQNREATLKRLGCRLEGRGPTHYSSAERWVKYCKGLDKIAAQVKYHGPRKGKIRRDEV